MGTSICNWDKMLKKIKIKSDAVPVARRNSRGWKSRDRMWPWWNLKSCKSFPAVRSQTCWIDSVIRRKQQTTLTLMIRKYLLLIDLDNVIESARNYPTTVRQDKTENFHMVHFALVVCGLRRNLSYIHVSNYYYYFLHDLTWTACYMLYYVVCSAI